MCEAEEGYSRKTEDCDDKQGQRAREAKVLESWASFGTHKKRPPALHVVVS